MTSSAAGGLLVPDSMREAALRMMDEDGSRVEWTRRTLMRLAKVFPFPDGSNRELCDSLYPHAQFMFDSLDSEAFYVPGACTLLYNVGVYLRDRSLYDKARDWLS